MAAASAAGRICSATGESDLRVDFWIGAVALGLVTPVVATATST